ncbi:MAG: hypothetical protein HQL22_11765, partial [Candidatus Omnitrophica bacterium]|nr:hypothetical protein [Candidatus Omnitrophota bacterium]
MFNYVGVQQFKRFACLVLALVFTVQSVTSGYSQEILIKNNALNLPQPGAMVALSLAFNPPVLKGVTLHPEDPFKFDFILDKGDVGNDRDHSLQDESSRLVKYFLSSVTTPEKDMWVNLSPYEKDRIIPDEFGQTDMGRDLLAQDYMLKQITASLIYPEGETGKIFWAKVYKAAYAKYGTTDIPVDTFNKVWIVPEYAKVYEHGNTAFVVKARMKVMLETDYLATSTNAMPTRGHVAQDADNEQGNVSPRTLPTSQPMNARATQGSTSTPTPDALDDPSTIAKAVLRDIVIPQLEQEVNTGTNFAPLRQVYYSLILALWFKRHMKDSILGRKYVDQNKIQGIERTGLPQGSPEFIYQQYLQAFKQGVYNYIKEETDPLTMETIPRKYFSGGFSGESAAKNTEISEQLDSNDRSMLTLLSQGKSLVRLMTTLMAQKPVMSQDEVNYRNTVLRQFLSMMKFGLVGFDKAREASLNRFKGADPTNSEKGVIAVVEEIKSFKDYQQLEGRPLSKDEYENYLNEGIVRRLLRLNASGTNPVEIIAERNTPSLAGETQTATKNELEERLRTGVMILMKTKSSFREIREKHGMDAVPNCFMFPELPPDMIEAVFVPQGMVELLKGFLPRQFRGKIVAVDKQKISTEGDSGFLQLMIPDWEGALSNYLKKNSQTRTLLLHGSRFPTREEIAQVSRRFDQTLQS